MTEQEINETLKDLSDQEIELEKITSEITEKLGIIWDKKDKLQEELFNLQSKGIEVQSDNWYIYTNDIDCSYYHYSIFELIHIKEIKNKIVKYVEYDLREDDGDLRFLVVSNKSNLKSFKRKLYDVYKLISEEEAKQYIEKGLKLEVTDED